MEGRLTYDTGHRASWRRYNSILARPRACIHIDMTSRQGIMIVPGTDVKLDINIWENTRVCIFCVNLSRFAHPEGELPQQVRSLVIRLGVLPCVTADRDSTCFA